MYIQNHPVIENLWSMHWFTSTSPCFTLLYHHTKSVHLDTPGYMSLGWTNSLTSGLPSHRAASPRLRCGSQAQWGRMWPDVAGDSGDDPLRKICRSAEIQRKSNVKGCEGFTQFTLVYGMNCSSKAFFFWPTSLQVILKRHPPPKVIQVFNTFTSWKSNLKRLAFTHIWIRKGWSFFWAPMAPLEISQGIFPYFSSCWEPTTIWCSWCILTYIDVQYSFLTLHEWYPDDVPPKRPLNGHVSGISSLGVLELCSRRGDRVQISAPEQAHIEWLCISSYCSV